MANAQSATVRSRRKIGATDSIAAAAATSSLTDGRPSLAEFAGSIRSGGCLICTHPDRQTIEDGLKEGYSPGTVGRYLRIVCGEKAAIDTLRKRIVRHQESCNGET